MVCSLKEYMKTISFLVATFLCGFVIYLTELNHRQVKYDCRYVTYPLAIDIPQEIIKQCQGKIL